MCFEGEGINQMNKIISIRINNRKKSPIRVSEIIMDINKVEMNELIVSLNIKVDDE